MAHEISGQHLIAGQWRSLVGAGFTALDPATGKVVSKQPLELPPPPAAGQEQKKQDQKK